MSGTGLGAESKDYNYSIDRDFQYNTELFTVIIGRCSGLRHGTIGGPIAD